MSTNGVGSAPKICEHLTTSHRSADEVDACPSRARKRPESKVLSTDPQIKDGRVYNEADRGDLLCLKDIPETHQNQNNKFENALEISQVRVFFESKESGDCDHGNFNQPTSSEDMIKLIPLNKDQDMLQITLLLEDIEKDLKCDTSRKGCCKTAQLYNNFTQNKYKGDESDVLIHQALQTSNSENLNLSNEYGEEVVGTGKNRRLFNEQSPETTDNVSTLKCEASTQTNLTETKHRDSQTESNPTDFSSVSLPELESSPSKTFTDFSMQCYRLEEDSISCFNNLLLKETASGLSSANKETESNIPEIESKVAIHVHTQTESCSDLPHSYQNKALDKSYYLEGLANCDMQSSDLPHSYQNKAFNKSYYPEGSANCDIQSNRHNTPELVDSGISSLQTLIFKCIKASIETPLSLIGQNNAPKSSTSTATQSDLKTTNDSNSQTVAGLAINNLNSMHAEAETRELCCDQTGSIPAIEVGNKISKSYSFNICPKPETLNCILSKTQEMTCIINNQTNNDLLYLKDSEKPKNSNLNRNNMKISSLKSANASELSSIKRNHRPVLPCHMYEYTATRKKTKHIARKRNHLTKTGNIKSLNKRINTSNLTLIKNVAEQSMNQSSDIDETNNFDNLTLVSDCWKSYQNPTLNKDELKYSPYPPQTNNVKKSCVNEINLNSTQDHKYFNPVLATDIETPPSSVFSKEDFIDCPYSSQITDENIFSLFPQSTSIEKRLNFDSNAEVQHEFFIADCLSGDSKTEEALPIHPRTSSLVLECTAKSFDFVRNKPLQHTVNPTCVELMEYPTKVDQNPYRLSIVDGIKVSEDGKKGVSNVMSTLIIESPDSKSVSTDKPQNSATTVVFSRKYHPDLESIGRPVICLCDDCYIRTQLAVDEHFVNNSGIRPAGDEVEFKSFQIESSSPTDAETPIESETVASETASTKSVIENVHPLCAVLNDHLLGLKRVDKDLLIQSKESLTKRWLTVAADRYSRAKEVYNYLQYFQEFSDTLAKFVLHSTDPEGNNALHFAYGNNRFDMAEELLNNKHGPALLRKRNKFGHTPLMICAISQPETQEDWITVKKSVKMGNVNEASPSSGQTALMNAASRGLTDMVRVLLSAGAYSNQRDRDGSTALMYATEQGREACVALMLEHPGCDPLLRDQDGQTASSIAIGAGHKDIALRIYLHTKNMPHSAVHQAMKANKKKSTPI